MFIAGIRECFAHSIYAAGEVQALVMWYILISKLHDGERERERGWGGGSDGIPIVVDILI